MALSATAFAQDVLYYKFDEAGGTKAINYASGSGIAPTEANLVGGNSPQYAPGKFGVSSLSGGTATSSTGSTYVDTGWHPNLTGSDFTLAFFLKQRTAPSSTSYFFYSNSGWRMFTGGVANQGLYFRNGTSGTDANWILTSDIQTPAASGWVHIALVVDATALTATYYVNGVAQPPLSITTGVNASGGTYSFHVAGFASYGGLYDIDDFRITLRAASAAEIATWAMQASPADSQYGAGCGGAALMGSGLPQLGTASYMLQISGAAPGALCALALGVNRLDMSGLPLPLDLGVVWPGLSGCDWECSADGFLGAAATAGGTASFAIPLPPFPYLDGATLFSQALILGPPTPQMTNGVSFGIGQ